MKSSSKIIQQKGGLIKTILIIVIAIAILSYLGFDLKKIFESDQSKSNFSYVWNGIVYAWTHYLRQPAEYFWRVVVVGFIWNVLVLPGIHALQAFQAKGNQLGN